MKCPNCRAEMKSGRENYKDDMCGLPGITLLGVEVRRCPACGEDEVVIPDIEGLHRAIAHAVIRKKERLTLAEIVFLRKWLGLSGVEFARAMDVSPVTVSRWENGRQPMSSMADRMLRLLVVAREPVAGYLELLPETAKRPAKPQRLGLRAARGVWSVAA